MFSILEQHYKNNRLHHAYLLIGHEDKVREAVKNVSGSLLSFDRHQVHRHPDFFEYKTDRLGIKDGHAIKQQAFLSSSTGTAKIFLIITNSFTKEAENALLKLLEEPPKETYFFIAASSLDNLSLILRSRLAVLTDREGYDMDEEKKEFLIKFLKCQPQKRLEIVKKLVDDRERTSEFVKGLELVALGLSEKKNLSDIIEDIKLSRSLIEHPALSCRLILEYLSLSLPRL